MTLIASDGLEYADFTQRLLGNPLENRRNYQVKVLQTADYAPEEVKAWYTAYDKARGGHPDKYAAGWRGVTKQRERSNRAAGVAGRPPGRAGVPNPLPQAPSALHPAH